MIDSSLIDKEVLSLIPPEASVKDKIIPLSLKDGILSVAVRKPDKHRLVNKYSFITGYRLNAVEHTDEEIDELLAGLYSETNHSSEENHKPVNGNTGNVITSSVEFVNTMIDEAVDTLASDIHFELYDKEFRVRYRIDGHLIERIRQSGVRNNSIFSRIKVMANLDISEKRRPQDGKIKYRRANKEIDIRVSTLPTQYGEKIVLRILDASSLSIDIEDLGMKKEQKNILTDAISLPYGMILVTGPTGSGKSTTLYAVLRALNSIDKNIVTIEDPIEYNIRGINQTHVKPDIGFTFAQALRAFLRQDPDIIMVGEIRDNETAEIAIRASLTGHLVFSTLHTNDSISAVTRLLDMGIDSFLVASSLKLVIAQRLVRRLCRCSKNGRPNENAGTSKKGCKKCYYTGFKGRIGIFEMLRIDDEVSHLISQDTSVQEIRKKISEHGFITLYDSGMDKVRNGVTTYDEIKREITT
jgi:type IV pilus assembly protein PilB